MEIVEEEEEEVQQPAKRQSLIKEEEAKQGDKKAQEEVPVKLDADLATAPENTKFSADNTSELPNFVGADANAETEPASDDLSPGETNRRMSSQSSRAEVFTSYSSVSSYAAYAYSKPKVKLGPRPSLDTHNRPQTAGNFRPVASIPAGVKLFGKGGSASKKSSLGRKDSVGSNASTTYTLSPQSDMTEISFATSAAVPIPEEPTTKAHFDSLRPNTSSGVSTKSNMTSMSKQAMTPEKARLKKAMQLREKKKKKAANAPPTPTAPNAPTATDETENIGKRLTPDENASGDSTVERAPIVKADSGIAIDASPASTKAGDFHSDRTQTDSQPTSPVHAPSEAEHSTKASSVTDGTSETVEANNVKFTNNFEDAGSDEPEATEKSTYVAIESQDETTPIAEGRVDEQASARIPEAKEREEQMAEVIETAKQSNTDDVAEQGAAPSGHQESKTIQQKEQSIPDAATGSEDVAVPAPKSSDNIPAVPEDSATTTNTDDHELETQKVPELEDPKSTEHADTAESHLPANVIKDRTDNVDIDEISTPLKRQSPEESPQIKRSERAVDEQASDAETISPVSRRQLSDRRKPIEPIRTDLTSRPASYSFSDDESLMDELQSATVQEARPMFVSKTPVTPVFPGMLNIPGGQMSTPSSATSPGKPQVVRTVSNPVRGGNFTNLPTDVSESSARSLSQGAAYLHKVTQQRTADGNLAKKNNVGSSISQRIKALEMLSAETGSQPGSRPSSTFFSVKKDRVPSRSPSVVDRANSLTIDKRPSTANSREHSPAQASKNPRDRSGSISSRLSMFEPLDSPGNTPRGRPESVSVTARIIRDSPSQSRSQSDQGHLDLKESPLQVDHQAVTLPDLTLEPARDSMAEPRPSISRENSGQKEADSRRSSFSIVRDFIKEGRKSLSSPSTDNLPTFSPGPKSPSHPPSAHQNTTFSRLSISGRRSLSRDRANVASVLSDDDDSRSNTDKKASRTSRLMRRLSSLSGSSRNSNSNSKVVSPSGGTPTVAEEVFPDPVVTASAPPTADGSYPSIAAYMGDVNVQFPDTLLWKRRNMYLDSQGTVVLSSLPQQQSQHTQQRTGVKRFHLSEFKTPYAPDVEVQELPNSVVLDLIEGSAVQVACEDRAGQMHVLHSKFVPCDFKSCSRH